MRSLMLDGDFNIFRSVTFHILKGDNRIQALCELTYVFIVRRSKKRRVTLSLERMNRLTKLSGIVSSVHSEFLN